MTLLFCVGCSSQPFQHENHSQLPQLYIFADSLQIDSIYKINRKKIPAYAVFVTSDNDTLYDDSLSYLRTRGNYSFTHAEKKPFTLKLLQSTRFPGLSKNKDFVLLANAFDESHIHNAIAFDVAKAIGVLAPDYTYVLLYLNDECKGLYQMTNKVEVSKRFVHIEDLERIHKEINPQPLDSYPRFSIGDDWQPKTMKGYELAESPSDITGGFLLRYDWADEYSRFECGFISDEGDAVGVTCPKHASLPELQFIQQYYSAMEQAIKDPTNTRYQDYLDVESFAKYYLLQEILLNTDGGIGSMYMYKDSDGKMIAGPLWDMDVILNTTTSLDIPNVLYAAKPWEVQGKKTKGILYQLCQRSDFQIVCKDLYMNQISDVMHSYIEKGSIDSLCGLLQASADLDDDINHTRHGYTYSETKTELIHFFEARLQFFDWYYSTPRDSMICLTVDSVLGDGGSKYKYRLCFPKKEPITTPQYLSLYNNAHNPTLEWYITGTDTLLRDGMSLDTDYSIVCRRAVPPSWFTLQKRRIRNRINAVAN